MKQISFGPGNRWSGALGAILTALGTLSLQAHPGHALGDQGWAHVVSSPYHLSVLAGGGLALWLGARFVQRQGLRRLMRWGGLAALAAAAVLFGLRV